VSEAPAKVSVLVVDDEAPARQRLVRLVGEIAGARVAAEAANGREALQRAIEFKPDVVLLDVRMPEMDGIEAARHLALLPVAPAVIFTTAYDEYALAAFEAQAIGYLLKPVRRDKLEAALATARRLTRPALAPLAGGAKRSHFAARVRDQLRLVPVADVLACVADQKYVTLHHREGTDLIEESLRSIEEEFSAEFVRVHRSALAAVRHVAAVDRDAEGRYHIRMRDSELRLEVSRRLAGDLLRRLKLGEPS
jgi:two-component system, LytTR family, response regulator AlgR